MKDILSEIIANKRFEIDLQKQAIPSEQLQEKLSDEVQPGYSMKQALATAAKQATTSQDDVITLFIGLRPKAGSMKMHVRNKSCRTI